MHIAARPDPLHDLLSQVTALVEVQRAHLRRLLRQVALHHIHSVGGNALGDAKCLQGRAARRFRSRRSQRLPQVTRLTAAGIHIS